MIYICPKCQSWYYVESVALSCCQQPDRSKYIIRCPKEAQKKDLTLKENNEKFYIK